MNTTRTLVYWFLLFGLMIGYYIRHSRLMTRLHVSAGLYIWPDFCSELRSYLGRREAGLTRPEFKRLYGHQLAAIARVYNGNRTQLDWFSPKLEELLGRLPSEMSMALVHPEDREKLLEDNHAIIHGGGNSHQVEQYRLLNRNGEWRYFSVQSWSVERINNDVIIYRVLRDITAEKALRDLL